MGKKQGRKSARASGDDLLGTYLREKDKTWAGEPDDHELFAVDTLGNSGKQSRKARKRALEEVIEPAPQPTYVKPASTTTTTTTSTAAEARKKPKKSAARYVNLLAADQTSRDAKAKQQRKASAPYDLWATPVASAKPVLNELGFNAEAVHPLTKKPDIRPKQFKHTRSNVILHNTLDLTAHSGTSFNPSTASREQLLKYSYQIDAKDDAARKKLIKLQDGVFKGKYDITEEEFEKQVEEDERRALRLQGRAAPLTADGGVTSSSATAADADTTTNPTDDSWMDEQDPISLPPITSKKQARPKTMKEKRRKLAHKQRLKEEYKKQQQKQFRRELENLPFIIAELQRTSKEQRERQLEREAIYAELRKRGIALPTQKQHPRLGKRLTPKFPYPAVALAEDVEGGSLRRIKPVMGLIKQQLERYEHRHLIEPVRDNEDKKFTPYKQRDKHIWSARKLNVLPEGVSDE